MAQNLGQIDKNLMDIQINFYDQYLIHEYRHQIEVHQFQQTQFKLQFGNIQQSKSNYLLILIRNLFLLNCNQVFSEQNCHYSCQECDGPTNEDCLSCSKELKRIYLPEHKVCICPYNTIDDQICIGYKEAGLELIDEPFLNNECQYGYFELGNNAKNVLQSQGKIKSLAQNACKILKIFLKPIVYRIYILQSKAIDRTT
ncbi:unnamed protein product [Paramecium octaurelia]|uniref:Uncharacterized protein n=1 Tax=Paramecium octaurelia TaxID=43137 RepID=A0A8S1YN52_PAROT|nr:unnamed protein product [Paramecium octaurelia]